MPAIPRMITLLGSCQEELDIRKAAANTLLNFSEYGERSKFLT
jgi:hypothetical protein